MHAHSRIGDVRNAQQPHPFWIRYRCCSDRTESQHIKYNYYDTTVIFEFKAVCIKKKKKKKKKNVLYNIRNNVLNDSR